MIHAHAEAVKSTNGAVANKLYRIGSYCFPFDTN
jgi:hypothetical protein